MNLGHRRLARLLSGSLVARAIGAGCALVLQVVVARMLGLDASGLIYTALSVILLFSIVGKLGMDAALLRHAGRSWQSGNTDEVARLYGRALSTLLLAGGLLGLCLYLGRNPLAHLLSDQAGLAALLGALVIAIPLQGVTCLQGALLKATDRQASAALLEVCLIPVGTLIFVTTMAPFVELTAVVFASAYAASTVLAVVIGHHLLALPNHKVLSALRQPLWLSSSLNLTGIDLLNYALAAAALPIVSMFSGASEAGYFNAALRLSVQVGMVGIIVGSLFASRFSALHDAGAQHQVELARLARKGTQLMLLLSTPALAVFVLWPEFSLLLFGADFAAMCTPLRWLALGQLINMMTGPAGYLLVMTGHERDLRNLSVLTVCLSLPLTALLATHYGATGAAAATSFGLLLQNLGAVYAVKQRLGISTWPWASLPDSPYKPAIAATT